ncbi:hypothetical protein ES703_56078 [subsurface metagenome]
MPTIPGRVHSACYCPAGWDQVPKHIIRINTFWPLVVPRFLAHNPFYIFLMRQFFLGIPQDLSDAARMDGCSDFGIWWRIVLPTSKPVLAAVGTAPCSCLAFLSRL